MKQSQLLGRTLRENQEDNAIKSHDLLLRAGFVRQLSSGLYSYLNLGLRSMNRIMEIIREEMNDIGGVEINMPVVHPAEIWKETGRYHAIDDTLVRLQDRTGKDLVLAMTHEEVVAFLAKSEIQTYKQLPKMIYQFQTKFRDELRPRGGLIRVKEFIMKDAYTLDTDWEGLQVQYDLQYQAYLNAYARVGLPVEAILSDVGMMGGSVAHEYMYITDIGEDTIFLCEASPYKANKEIATFEKTYPQEEEKELAEIHTPDSKTIDDLVKFLGIEANRLGKTIALMGEIEEEEKLILAVISGHLELNLIKLGNQSKAKNLRFAKDEEISAAGGVPGFLSPVGLNKDKVFVIVDDLAKHSPNLVMGANKVDTHLTNVCYGRDYTADLIVDIVSAYDGAPTPQASLTNPDAKLRSVRGVEVGNIFQLGTKYTEALGAYYTDANGRTQPIIMGSYGIGVGRVLACLAEEYNDEKGLCLPITVSPFEVHLIGLLFNDDIAERCEEIYQQLKTAGIDVLYDNRAKKVASPGQKFADSDLIGIPIRIVLSPKSLDKGGVEIKLRKAGDSEIIPLEDIVQTTQDLIANLMKEQVLPAS